MQLLDLRNNTFSKLGEVAGGVFYPQAEVDGWINQGQVEFCLLQVDTFVRTGLVTTALLAKKATVATTGGDWRLYPITLMADFVFPLRVVFGNKPLMKTPHKMLDRLDPDWENAAGNPQHWGILGANLMFIHPRPLLTVNLDVTYACTPPTLSADTDVPAISAEYHYLLEEYAVYLCLAKEGKARLNAALLHFNTFLRGALSFDKESLPRKKG